MEMKILYCTCKHEYQDIAYGKNRRIHNYTPKANNGLGGWRCTVCGEVKKKG